MGLNSGLKGLNFGKAMVGGRECRDSALCLRAGKWVSSFGRLNCCETVAVITDQRVVVW
jgi:hypothetical protein